MCHTAGFECRNKSTDLILKRLVKLVLSVKEIIDQFWFKKKRFRRLDLDQILVNNLRPGLNLKRKIAHSGYLNN